MDVRFYIYKVNVSMQIKLLFRDLFRRKIHVRSMNYIKVHKTINIINRLTPKRLKVNERMKAIPSPILITIEVFKHYSFIILLRNASIQSMKN